MRIATFNINDINKRLANLLDWMAAAQPDVVCLQELKCEDRAFPIEAIQAAGFGAVWRGDGASCPWARSIVATLLAESGLCSFKSIGNSCLRRTERFCLRIEILFASRSSCSDVDRVGAHAFGRNSGHDEDVDPSLEIAVPRVKS